LGTVVVDGGPSYIRLLPVLNRSLRIEQVFKALSSFHLSFSCIERLVCSVARLGVLSFGLFKSH